MPRAVQSLQGAAAASLGLRDTSDLGLGTCGSGSSLKDKGLVSLVLSLLVWLEYFLGFKRFPNHCSFPCWCGHIPGRLLQLLSLVLC